MDKPKCKFIKDLTPLCVVYKHLEGQGREERCLFTHTHFYCLLTSKVTLLPLKRVTRVIRASFMTAFLKDKTPKSRDIAMNEWQIFSTMTEIIFDIRACTFCRVKRGFCFLAQEIIDYCCYGNWCYEIMRSFHIWKARAFSHKVWAIYDWSWGFLFLLFTLNRTSYFLSRRNSANLNI